MEAHWEQQESMFEEATEIEQQEYAESYQEPEPNPDEDTELLFEGSEPDADSYSAIASKPAKVEPAGEETHETVNTSTNNTSTSKTSETKVDEAKASDTKPAAELTPLSADDFSALEERVLRAVKLVQGEREARIAAEDRVSQLQTQLDVQGPLVEKLQGEIELLRLEREQVRQRVERLLAQLDALEL